MWQIRNGTPFAAAQSWVRGLDGAETWLVAVKATFDILPDGSTAVAVDQPPVLRAPQYQDEPGRSSLRYENDLVLCKATTDVLALGHAHAPGGRPVTELDVGLRVGPVQKVLHVSGDRRRGSFGPSPPEPFVKMPLVYERAFGGVDPGAREAPQDWDARNPVGTGYLASRAGAAEVMLPNVEYPDQALSFLQGRPEPAGLGPVASHWQPRAAFAGTYDDEWRRTRQPLLPADFDVRFFQCAPADQQAPAFLTGGEPVLLRHMTEAGLLRFDLPRVELALRTVFMDGEKRDHPAPQLHTVILEPDFPRVSMVWHSALECHAKVYQLDHTRVEFLADQGPAHEDDTAALLGF